VLIGGPAEPARSQAQKAIRQATKRPGAVGARKGILPQRRPQKRAPAGNAQAAAVNNLVMRLMQMPPDRRREFLQSNERLRQLPVGSRAAIERRLKQIDEMPEDERELLIQRYQLFSRLGPNQQATARSLYEDWQSMPRERRQEMTEAVRRLRQTPAAEREQALGAQRFQRRFSKQEQEMVRQLLKMTPPQAPSSARP
jgi:hypothetical protein